MTRTCAVTHPDGVTRCALTKSHRGDHGAGDVRWPRGARGGAVGDGRTASIVLSALATGASYAEAAEAAGVSRARAHAIAQGAQDRPATQAELVARLRELAAAADLSPSEYLDEAAGAIAAADRAVEVLGAPGVELTDREREVWRLLVQSDAEIAATIRGGL